MPLENHTADALIQHIEWRLSNITKSVISLRDLSQPALSNQQQNPRALELSMFFPWKLYI